MFGQVFQILLLFIYCMTGTSVSRSHMTSDIIPESLVACYKKNVPLMPMTMRTFIDIIRKIELNPYTLMDMRMLSNSILHRFWREGIEKDPNIVGNIPETVTPYRPSGFQSYKYKLLIDNLLPPIYKQFPNDSLTLSEQCTLHFMLSSSVYAWERGDERETCPTLKTEQRQLTSGQHKRSSCPEEKGVVLAGCGWSLSPGRVLAGVAAVLQPLVVPQARLVDHNYSAYFQQTNLIDNKWAATIAGDLAEIILTQAAVTKKLYLGPPGKWNDSLVPVRYYLTADYNKVATASWQCTQAELIGSIDGLILAEEAKRFVDVMGTMNLSQLLEMYYSDVGGHYPTQMRSTDRKAYYFEHLSKQGKTIVQQTKYFSEVLSIIFPHYFTNNEYLDLKSKEVFDAFRAHLYETFERDDECPTPLAVKPRLKMNIIFDSTWTPYERLRLFMSMSEDLDVSAYGGRVNIINGKTGEFVVRNAETVGNLYLQWQNATDESKDPVGLDLTRSLLAVKAYIENSTSDDGGESYGHVTVVVGLASPITDRDAAHATGVLSAIKAQKPEMQFLYVTSPVSTQQFVKLTGFLNSGSDHVTVLQYNTLHSVKQKLVDFLADVPRIFKPGACKNDNNQLTTTYGEYISPGIIYNYKIPSPYICFSTRYLIVKIKNSNYGTLAVCMTRLEMQAKAQQDCRDVGPFGETMFTISKPCDIHDENVIKTPMGRQCRNVYLMIKGGRSLNKCTENGCRFPDQIYFSVTLKGLNCIQDNYIKCSAPTNTITRQELSLILVILLFHVFCYKYIYRS